MKRILPLLLLYQLSVMGADASLGRFEADGYLGQARRPRDVARYDYEMPDKLANWLFDQSPKVVKELVDDFNDPLTPDEKKKTSFLLYGPSGTGKTALTIAIAKRANLKLTPIDASALGDKYQHSRFNHLTGLIDPALQSNTKQVIAIDEITRLLEQYDDNEVQGESNNDATRVWQLIDKCVKNKNILLIGTANAVGKLPSQIETRFAGEIIKIDLPGREVRKSILQFYLPIAHTCTGTCVDRVAAQTDGVCPRVLMKIVEAAERKARRRGEYGGKITDEDIQNALKHFDLPDHYIVAFYKKQKDAFVENLTPLNMVLFCWYSYQAYSLYKNLQSQEESLSLQRRGLDLQAQSLAIAEQGLALQQEQVAVAEHLRTYEGRLEESIIQGQVQATHRAAATPGAITGGAIGGFVGSFGGPVGTVVGTAAGSYIGSQVSSTVYVTWDWISAGASRVYNGSSANSST